MVGRHASLVFLAAAALGLGVPGLELLPPWLGLALVGSVIFLACFTVEPAELRGLHLSGLAVFAAWRFVVLPVLVFFLVARVAPEHALAVLVLGLMPPAVATPGLVAILGGNVALSLALLVGVTVLTPALVPPIVSWAAGDRVALDPHVLGRTLVFAVLLPIAAHVPLRRFEALRRAVGVRLGFLSVVLIAASIALVVAQRRQVLFDDLASVPASLALGAVAYLGFYGAGLAVPGVARRERLALAVGSGANNIVLGMSVVVLYLPPSDGAWVITCLVPWALGLMPLRYLHRA